MMEPARLSGRSPALDGNSSPLYSQPLDSRRHEIRILRICKVNLKSTTVPFECKLEICKLWRDTVYSDLDTSRFVALSYCWGEYTDETDLTVDGHIVRVSSNLRAALCQLWEIGEYRVWVDFICINQQDSDEKGSQVAMMDKIYTRANVVYAWLGPGNAESDLAMTALSVEKQSTYADLLEEPGLVHEAVARLLSRPYFTRMWIIQEICMPDAVVFLCGSKKTPYGTWVTKLYALNGSVPAQYAQHLFAPIRGFRALERDRKLGKGVDLISWLIRTRRSQAKDPRDKIYALLSLASDGNKVVMAPNYEQTVLQICRDVTTQMIVSGHRTDVLLLAHRTEERDGWPSWVPNWTRMRSKPPPWVINCLDMERRRLLTRNKVDRRTLTVRGMRIDKVVTVLCPTGATHSPEPADYLRSRDVIAGLRNYLMFRSFQGSPLEFAQAMVIAHQQYDESHKSLCTWMSLYAHQTIGTRSVLEHLLRFCGDPTAPVKRTEVLHKVAEHIDSTIAFFGSWGMLFVVGKTTGIQMAYRDVMVGDLIYKVNNCRANVILRVLANGDYVFVGELFPLNGRIEAPHLEEEVMQIQ